MFRSLRLTIRSRCHEVRLLWRRVRLGSGVCACADGQNPTIDLPACISIHEVVYALAPTQP